jgi:spermidine/putrescine transport system permease protein
VLSVALGTLYAYAVWRSEGRLRTLLLAGVLVSMFTTLVVKLFALRLLLVPNGPVNGLLLGTGLLSEPLALVNNLTGVVLGQLYIVVPYSVLAVYSVLSSVDERTVEAARDLGASGPRAFVEVVLPHAGPGIAVATVVSFTWSVGAYAAPFLLGSNDQRTVGMEVAALLGQDFDWTAAAALAVALTVVVLGVLAAAAVGLTRRGGDDG